MRLSTGLVVLVSALSLVSAAARAETSGRWSAGQNPRHDVPMSATLPTLSGHRHNKSDAP
jgi:hypothetical protein